MKIAANKIKWVDLYENGYPPYKWRFNKHGVERDFLIKGEYSIFCAPMLKDGSGFNLPDHVMDIPKEWAIVEGF